MASGAAPLGCSPVVVGGSGRAAASSGAAECSAASPAACPHGCSGNGVWSKRFGASSDDDGAEAVAVDATGNVAIAGIADGPIDFGAGSLPAGGFVAKLDPAGAPLWAKSVPGADFNAAAFDVKGRLFVTGRLEQAADLGGGMLDGPFFLAAYDQDGQHVFSRAAAGMTNDLFPSPNALGLDADGNVVIAGELVGSIDFGTGPLASAGGKALFVGKFDASGQPIWVKAFQEADTMEFIEQRLAVDPEGAILLSGRYSNIDFGAGPLPPKEDYGGAMFVVKLSPAGALVWSRSFATNYEIGWGDLATDAAGDAVITGTFGDEVDFGGGKLTKKDGGNVFVAKLDRDGNHVWSKAFGDDDLLQMGTGVTTDGDGNIIVTGQAKGTIDFGGGPLTSADLAFNGDIFIAKFGPCGDHVWSKLVGESSTVPTHRIAVGASGELWVAGGCTGTLDFGAGQSNGDDIHTDAYVAKVLP